MLRANIWVYQEKIGNNKGVEKWTQIQLKHFISAQTDIEGNAKMKQKLINYMKSIKT